MSNKTEKNLFLILCTIGLVAVFLITSHLNQWNFKNVLQDLSMNVLTSLAIFLGLYAIFTKNGIDLKRLVNSLNDSSENIPKWLVNGYSKFTEIRWKKYINQSKKLTVVAFYFDEWISQNRELLKEMLMKKKSHLCVILPNPENDELLEEIVKIIPKFDKDDISYKIKHSVIYIEELAKGQRGGESIVEIYYYDKLFNYTMQIFDDKFLFLSINELSRKENYQSPFILFDITQEEDMEEFFVEEIKFLKDTEKYKMY